MQPRFVDTNILLRYLVRDNQEQAERSLNLLLRVERGEEKVYTSSLVIFETVFTLQKFYKVPRQDIAEQLLTIISLRNFHVPEKDVYRRAFNLYISKNIPFGDAYNAAYALEEEQPVVYSWDKDFDKIDGITRVEPE
jgi:predicted nucleic acid-binding protein